MIEWIIWAVSFISLYVGVFWLHVVSLSEEKKTALASFPRVSIIVPAYNEEKGLAKTVRSLCALDYPKEKLEIIIVDHGSTDTTASIGRQLVLEHPSQCIQFVQRMRSAGEIKSHAFNEGLKHATGEFVACVDADTVVIGSALREMLPHFADAQVGAVISTIKVSHPTNIYEKIQHLEYIFATFTRGLMSKINTLHVTPGALSVYRKILFDRYGGFDENNVTEDLEMAMRLRYHGYTIKLAKESVNYTRVPNTFNKLWAQRVRWFRGFMYNSMKYKKMLFRKKYELLGTFQYPLNIISIFTVLLMFSLLAYTFFDTLLIQISKLQAIGLEYFYFDFNNLPTIKQLILDLNITLLFPIMISLFVGLFIYHLAHKNLKEKWRYPGALLTYLTLYPVVRSCHWVTAAYKEVFRVRKKW